VQQPECYQGKGDNVGAYHPFLVNGDAPFQDSVIRHTGRCSPRRCQTDQANALCPTEGGVDGHTEGAQATDGHAGEKSPARPAMQADSACGNPTRIATDRSARPPFRQSCASRASLAWPSSWLAAEGIGERGAIVIKVGAEDVL